MGLKEDLTEYIMELQEYGLELNEDKSRIDNVNIETHADLLNSFIGIINHYRDYVDRKEAFLSGMSEVLGLKKH